MNSEKKIPEEILADLRAAFSKIDLGRHGSECFVNKVYRSSTFPLVREFWIKRIHDQTE